MSMRETARMKKHTELRRLALQRDLPPEKLAVSKDYPVMQVMAYRAGDYTEAVIQKPEEAKAYLNSWEVVWLNVDGQGDEALIRQIGEVFHLHWLMIEDVMHRQQRAKAEDYGNFHFIVARMVVSDQAEIETEQVSICVSQKVVITFQERSGGDCLDPVRQAIRRGQEKVRERKAPFLTYLILESIVNAYHPILDVYGEYLEDLEDRIASDPTKNLISEIHGVKRDLLTLRRAIWPLRDGLHQLLHESSLFSEQEAAFYLRDCLDHTLRVIDLIEVNRELCADLMDFYLSNVGNRTNDVMKVLTIISTIFMPLTFVAGVYGMNFNPEASRWNMPELNWHYGYPFALALMLIFAAVLVWFYRRKGWL